MYFALVDCQSSSAGVRPTPDLRFGGNEQREDNGTKHVDSCSDVKENIPLFHRILGLQKEFVFKLIEIHFVEFRYKTGANQMFLLYAQDVQGGSAKKIPPVIEKVVKFPVSAEPGSPQRQIFYESKEMSI